MLLSIRILEDLARPSGAGRREACPTDCVLGLAPLTPAPRRGEQGREERTVLWPAGGAGCTGQVAGAEAEAARGAGAAGGR